MVSAVYELVVEGVAGAVLLSRPNDSLVGVGPTQVGTTPRVTFRTVVGPDGEVELNLAL